MKLKSITYILFAATVSVLSSCSDVVRIETETSTDSTDPMRFTAPNENSQTATKASSPLTQGFLVSSWKAFGLAGQHVVMDKYEVQYKVDPWQGSSHWGYISDASNTFYQTQYERFWDYSNYPYRFYAISPCPPYSQISSFTLSPTSLSIPETVEFKNQSSNDGVFSEASEPYMPAQILRDADGHDYDLIMTDNSGNPKEINASSTTLNRLVSLPFHHLTSKVRFGFYSQDFGEGDSPILIHDVEVKVVSDNFTTSAKGYSANLSSSNMLGGDFKTRTKTSAHPVLLTTTSDNGTANDLRNCRDYSTAYMCKASSGLLQIPQDGVQIEISFKVSGKMVDSNVIDAYAGKITYDEVNNETIYSNLLVTLKDENGSPVTTFNWKNNTLYSYYFVLSRYFPLTIQFTSSLTPWENVNGALDTDLEK